MVSSATMFQIAADPVPLEKWDDGSVRISGTRIQYYIVLQGYLNGDGPETLLASFPDLDLATVHQLLAYYHRHQSEVHAWLAQIEIEAEELRQQVEEKWPSAELRRRLRQRWAEMHASGTD